MPIASNVFEAEKHAQQANPPSLSLFTPHLQTIPRRDLGMCLATLPPQLRPQRTLLCDVDSLRGSLIRFRSLHEPLLDI